MKEIKTLAEARAYFQGDRYATEATGIVIEAVRSGFSRVSLNVEARHRNAAGLVMGAVYYTMADFAFAVAANFDRPLTLTVTSSISFLNPARGKILYAEARLRKAGRRSCTAEVAVSDDCGTDVAIVTLNGMTIAE